MSTYDYDPNDALDTQWLRDHDGAPALDPPHPEDEARDWVLDSGHWLLVRVAAGVFSGALAYIEIGADDEAPY